MLNQGAKEKLKEKGKKEKGKNNDSDVRTCKRCTRPIGSDGPHVLSCVTCHCAYHRWCEPKCAPDARAAYKCYECVEGERPKLTCGRCAKPKPTTKVCVHCAAVECRQCCGPQRFKRDPFVCVLRRS
jgi:hypothetical protein